MEKVSRIIPSNARVESVDLTNAKPGRTRLPGMDKEEVKHSERLPGSELTAVDRLSKSEDLKLLKPDEAHHAAIAQKINQEFFRTYNKSAELNFKPEAHTETADLAGKTTQAAEVLAGSLKVNNSSEPEELEEFEPPTKNIDLTPEREKSINGEHQNFSKYA